MATLISEPSSRAPARLRRAFDFGLGTILVAYGLVAAWAIAAYRFNISPDGISYISVAREYLRGDFGTAINAYWSPLYSWLLVPLLGAGLPPLLANQVLAALVGAGALVAVWLLAGNLHLRAASRAIVCTTLVPVVLYFGASSVTPDLLSTTCVLFYLAHVTRGDYPRARFAGVLTGIWGGLGYLAKAYVMWFFLLHFLAITAVALWQRRQPAREVLRTAATALLTFALLAGTWAAALTHKYARPTAGTSGAYNYALNGPDSPGFPMDTQGFLPPSNPAAISAWEDPTYHRVTPWNPLGTPENRRHQAALLQRNVKEAFRILQGFSPLAATIVLTALLFAGSPMDPQPRRPALILVLAVLVYPLGYLLLNVETRYFSQLAVLLLLLGMFLIDVGWRGRLGPARRRLAVAVLCGTFAVRPAWALVRDRGAGRDIDQTSRRLADVLPPGSRIASDGHWHASLFLAFHRGLTYYGQPKPGATAAETESDLKRHPIDFFLAWDDAQILPFTSQWPEVSQDREPGLKIYRIPADLHAR